MPIYKVWWVVENDRREENGIVKMEENLSGNEGKPLKTNEEVVKMRRKT